MQLDLTKVSVEAIVCVGSMLVSILSCIIVKLYVHPLEGTLERLTTSVDKMSDKVDKNFDKMDKSIDEIRERLFKVEASTSSAHKRLDAIKK